MQVMTLTTSSLLIYWLKKKCTYSKNNKLQELLGGCYIWVWSAFSQPLVFLVLKDDIFDICANSQKDQLRNITSEANLCTRRRLPFTSTTIDMTNFSSLPFIDSQVMRRIVLLVWRKSFRVGLPPHGQLLPSHWRSVTSITPWMDGPVGVASY